MTSAREKGFGPNVCGLDGAQEGGYGAARDVALSSHFLRDFSLHYWRELGRGWGGGAAAIECRSYLMVVHQQLVHHHDDVRNLLLR
jgi:hypothetical protein